MSDQKMAEAISHLDSKPALQAVAGENRGIAMDSIISSDGSTLYYCAVTPEKDGEGQAFAIEQWNLSSQTPQLIKQTQLETNTTGNQISPGKSTQNGLATSQILLIPSKTSAMPSKPVQFLGHGSFLQVGTHLHEIDSGCPPEDRPKVPKFCTEYWEGADRRGNFVVVSRRKQPQENLDPKEESTRQENLAKTIAEHYKEWYPKGKPSRTYDDDIDFDDMVESSEDVSSVDDSSGSGDFIEASSIRSESFSSDNDEEENASAYSQEDDDDYGSVNDSESETSSTSQQSSSSFASSSTMRSTGSLERLRTYDVLDTSRNPAYFNELMSAHETKWCDECGKAVRQWYHCFVCQDADLDLCLGCIAKGYWCLDKAHQMLEADEEGPITFRNYSNWRLLHELRVYDTKDGEDCVLEFSMAGEGFLYGSGPVLHPTLSMVAWPMSPTKLLIASFDDASDRVIQRLKPCTKGGRTISIDLKFSPCGSYLFVAKVEATPSSAKHTSYGNLESSDSENKIFDLSVQVALYRLGFKDGTLYHLVPMWQKTLNTLAPVLSVQSFLPFTWTWTPSEILFTLTGTQITIYKLPIKEAREDQPPTLGLAQKLTVQALKEDELSQLKAQAVPDKQHHKPSLVLFPTSGNSAVVPQFHEIDREWTVIDNHHESRAAAEKRKQSYITSSQIAYDASPSILNKVRSEIRLLSLLPGKKGDLIRCKLSKVSLDDLERTKGKMNAFISDIYDRNQERTENNKPADATSEPTFEDSIQDPDFTPKELARMDSADFKGSDFDMAKLMGQGAQKVAAERGPGSINKIAFKNLDPKTSALVDMIFKERQDESQGRFKVSLPPQYNYEALSYVWGKSTQNRYIMLDNKKDFPVTDNLYAALGRLRRPEKARTLWVDSLCIDQQNTTERNHQVHMMGRIYNSAASVIAWLGDAGDIPKPIVPHPVTQTPESALAPASSDDNTADADPEKTLKEWQTSVLRDALSKASPPWWTRAWITQELVLASEVSVAFGEVELSWSRFYSDMMPTWRSIYELSRLFSLRLNRRHWQYKGSLGETALLARHCAATDPRDKVYSLLSLVTRDQAQRMTPDYALDPSEIFVKATYVDLWCNLNNEDVYAESVATEGGNDRGWKDRAPRYPVHGSLGDNLTVNTGMQPDRFRVLNWAKPTPQRMKGLPSWAVDFSDPTCFTEDAHFRYGYQRWTFDGNRDLYKRAEVDILADGKTLAVRGMVLDIVDKVVRDIPIREYKSRPVAPDLLNIFKDLPRENPYIAATGVAGAAQLRTENLRKVMRPKWIVTHTKPDTILISYEEEVEQILQSWDPSETRNVDWADLDAVDYTQCEIEGCRCGPSRLFKAWDKCVGLPDRARNLMNHDASKTTSPWDGYCEKLQKKDGEKGEDPLREEDIGFLLTTKRGFLGAGRDNIRAGDVIALFYGSDVPVVLRPLGGSLNCYTYEGRAWINGIMQGELWNIFDDPMLETQRFEIR